MTELQNHPKNPIIHQAVDPVDFWTDAFSESFTYDAVGNRTSTTFDGSPTFGGWTEQRSRDNENNHAIN